MSARPAPAAASPPDGYLRTLQERVLGATSLIYGIASLAVVVAVLMRAATTLGGIRPLSLVALVVPVVCFGAHFLRSRLSFFVRAASILGITTLASAIGMNRTGLLGAGMWALIMMVPVMTALYFGQRAAVWAFGANFLITLVIALRWLSGAHPLDYDAAAYALSPIAWLSMFMMALTLSAVVLAALHHLINAFIESTEQLRVAESQAQQSKERLSVLISNLPGIAFRGRADALRTMDFMSQGCQILTGYPAEDFCVGGSRSWRSIILAEDQEKVEQSLNGDLPHGDVYQFSYRICTAAGNTLWVGEQGRVTQDAQGQRCVEGIVTDHSAQKTLEEFLTREARTDPLTGLANRRRFDEQMQSELVRVHRYQGSCALLMLDVDHFKRVNDSWGHAVGDTVLKALAEQCLLMLRQSDTVGRLGGEEFAILLPETALAQAMETAERLRQRIATIVLPTGNHATLQFTVSIGCTVLWPQDAEIATALHRADTALYRAKNQGRNCVAGPVPSDSLKEA